MSDSKKTRDAARRLMERVHGPHEGGQKPSGKTNTRLVKPDIHREIRYITGLAQAEDSRIVTVGKLVLFSTGSRDAWLLDPEDNFAVCLCRDGEPQPFRIINAPQSFAIEWTARFEIEGPAFIIEERSARVVEIDGYPTARISAACRGLVGGVGS